MHKNFYLIAISVFMFTFQSCSRDICIDKSRIDMDAVCIQIYDPVCGCDGKTYPNSCFAENAGVTKWTKGECD